MKLIAEINASEKNEAIMKTLKQLSEEVLQKLIRQDVSDDED